MNNTVYKVTETKTSLYSDKVREYTQVGTLAELIDAYSYTLEAGKSYERERGNKKISLNPKNIDSLIQNLENAKDNCAANGYSGSSFSYEIVEDQVDESYNVISKRQLYESIMRNVSKQVKKTLNEMEDTNVKTNGVAYECSSDEINDLESYFIERAQEAACEDEAAYESRNGVLDETVSLDNVPYTFGDMKGTLSGFVTYAVEYYTTSDYEVITDGSCELEDYDLTFTYNGKAYKIQLD